MNYLTYEFIPKPIVLGILGAIAGFKGYSTQEETPEFYRRLADLKIGIEPLELKLSAEPPYSTKDFSHRDGVLQKTFVTYNNYHGYGSYEEGGNLIVNEQVLIKPAYRIFIEYDGCPKELREKLETEPLTSRYIPYMGKNEFLLSVISEGIKNDILSFNGPKTSINTIFFSDVVKDTIEAQEPGKQKKFYNIYENYPYKLENSHYRFKRVIYSDRMFEINSSTICENGYLMVNINGSRAFLF